MATVRELIQDAFVTLGEMGSGEVMSPEDANYGLLRLNSMLSSWSTRRLFIYNITIASYALAANTADYLIGPAQTFNAARPLRIDAARILLLSGATYVGVKDLDILTQGEYVELSDKTATAIIPEKLYNDYAYPYSTLSLYPRPSAAVGTKLELSTWTELAAFAMLGDTVSFPPGYYQAVLFNLAVELGPGYSKQPDQALAAKALEGMAAIQQLNKINGMADLGTQPGAGLQPSAGIGGPV